MTQTKVAATTVDAAVSTRGLVKKFGDQVAVDAVDLDVATGTVFGLLGPNGAGKTTIVRMLATLLAPDGGTASVGGFDVVRQAHAVRRVIGLTGQYASVDEALSGRENLYMIGRLLDMPAKAARTRADQLLETFGLSDSAKKLAKHYSGGMRRRLDLAASLVGTPQVLFLDEPTTGLDPQRRNDLWDIVRELAWNGTTVLLTTQYMEEAEALARQIAVMDRGRIIASGSPEELKHQVAGRRLRVRPADAIDLPVLQALMAEVLGTAREEGIGQVSGPLAEDEQLNLVLREIAAKEIALADVSTFTASLDEVFITLTGTSAGGDSDGGTRKEEH
ncbi:MAG TPA: ATP-binding cassette domain-containing protein [Actinocrinis sp.]|jgi:oleandomycin transport system ATP-binding protein|uniref:ATP-binding cassette domain-containing protein n=1 Tax=Actinocrinis sp. TaxID=1920516 RepID=UPI002D719C67|nr:ATP-binding cassette domain-containing protein [Actinocrinis sp.]HZU57509.1 ATP-binding cassette domain-containing protein [Actinocrinis sp.]